MDTNYSEINLASKSKRDLPQKALLFIYPEFQKHLEDIKASKKNLSTTPCFSTGSVRIKPIECDQSIKSLQNIIVSTEKVIMLIKNLDSQTALLVGSRNYDLLMKMYLAREKTIKLIETTRSLRLMSSIDSLERTKICMQAHREYSSFCNEFEKVEKEIGFLLDALIFQLTKNKNVQNTLVI